MPKSTSLRNAMCYETLLRAAAPRLPFQWRVSDEKAACGMCFTSGTTGNPKGVVYSHRSNTLCAHIDPCAFVMPLQQRSTRAPGMSCLHTCAKSAAAPMSVIAFAGTRSCRCCPTTWRCPRATRC